MGLAPTRVEAAAYAAAEVALPALAVGDHEVRIEATSGSGPSQHRDVLLRTIHVIDSRTVQGRTESALLDGSFVLHGGTTGFTTIVLSDAGRGRVLPVLLDSLGSETGRADEAIASSVARRVLQASFGRTADDLGPADGDLTSFQMPGGGVALFPYASEDLELSALAAVAGDDRFDPDGLAELFATVLDEADASSRDRRIVALVGMAALGRPVLDEIRSAAAEPSLVPAERAWLALGALAAGDDALATEIERAVLGASGERLGPWVRLSLGDAEVNATATAIISIVAAGIGDPLAADLDAFLEANPPKDTLLTLQRVLAARYWAERTPGTSAVASVTVDGTAKDVPVEPGAPVFLKLTPAQVGGVHLATKTGQVQVTTSWEAALDPSSVHAIPGLTFERTVTPAGAIAADQVVAVDLLVTLPEDALAGCWQVTDFVPSGLAPLAAESSWYTFDPDEGSGDVGGALEDHRPAGRLLRQRRPAARHASPALHRARRDAGYLPVGAGPAPVIDRARPGHGPAGDRRHDRRDELSSGEDEEPEQRFAGVLAHPEGVERDRDVVAVGPVRVVEADGGRRRRGIGGVGEGQHLVVLRQRERVPAAVPDEAEHRQPAAVDRRLDPGPFDVAGLAGQAAATPSRRATRTGAGRASSRARAPGDGRCALKSGEPLAGASRSGGDRAPRPRSARGRTSSCRRTGPPTRRRRRPSAGRSARA